MPIKQGNKVKIEYEGSFENGEIFDSSEKYGRALEFTVGKKQVIPGFENAVIGMEKEEEKEVTIQAKDAYGERNLNLVKKIPKIQFPEEQRDKLKKGVMLGLATPDGRQMPAIISDVSENEVEIDFNHPLAGKTLKFKIKVVDFS